MFAFALPLLLVLILVACVAFLYTEGMWNNAIRLINLVTAALLATNFYEPLAGYLESMLPSYGYACDFIALWALFALLMTLMCLVTDRISVVRVRFLKIVDQVGGGVFALLIGWVMVCFVAMSLHTAPLARTFLFGSFQPEQRMFMGLAPDRQWLSFVRSRSRGGLNRMATEAEQREEKHVFDPHGQFAAKYADRRSQLEQTIQNSGLRTGVR